jgi:hypothetical protein
MSAPPRVSLTRLLVAGSRCEACAEAGLISAQFNGQTRYYRREAERAAHVAEHGNLCELCGNPPKSRGLSEDHDHKTKLHRGWLCFRCNRALPTYVTLDWLRLAVAYLERAEAAR